MVKPTPLGRAASTTARLWRGAAASLLAVALLPGSSRAAQLPSVHSQSSATSTAAWWARVGDRVLVAPTADASGGLSRSVGDYYYALGSSEALTDELRERRVGGEGRWHVFHLPEGPSFLRALLRRNGSRRSSFSTLVQLQHETVLNSTFPVYERSTSYVHPLGHKGQELEKQAAALITAPVVKQYLESITSLGDQPGHATRSYSNGQATSAAVGFLQQQFQRMGLTTCLEEFQSNGQKLTNVIAYLAGQGADSVVVGAHYDSRPFDQAAPGAEDNGSGVAALLAIANALASAKVQPASSIYFVGFAAEEPGLLGSAAFAEELSRGGNGIPRECRAKTSFLQRWRHQAKHAAIAIDEVGWRSPKLDKPTVNLESFDWSKEVLEHLAQASKTLNGDDLTVVHSSHPFGSDHMSFLDRNIPAVLAINGDDEAYPNYHKETDTIDNVSPEFAAQISRMILGGAVRLAGVH